MSDHPELDQARHERDDALHAAEQSKAALAEAQGALAKTRADLEAANRLAETSRLELGQAKNRLAAEVMKAELAAGKDFDLDQRKRELTGMDLAALDQLRGQLRLSLAERGGEGPTPPPATVPASPVGTEAQPAAGKAPPLDLQALSLNDTLRLAFQQGAF